MPNIDLTPDELKAVLLLVLAIPMVVVVLWVVAIINQHKSLGYLRDYYRVRDADYDRMRDAPTHREPREQQ
jgi:hypothetical protein